MRSLVIATVLLLATAAGARAATLTTVPFPGFDLNDGSARCGVRNNGTVAGMVTLEMLNATGASLVTDGPVTLLAGDTFFGTPVSLTTDSPISCRITVPNTTRYRGDFIYLNGNFPPTVIRAQ
jgi:hypothetical protein